ncbi:MAG: lipoyl(octanoyl) transferase LipB [Flavobacteriales bacterium]|nr:lipoyl(octanoyl) transferase LipB [Flavobacteriales bacterium]
MNETTAQDAKHPVPVFFHDLGKMDYKECWDLQEKYFAATVQRKFDNRNKLPQDQIPTDNHLFFVEHPHVYTLGKSGDISHLLLDEDALTQVDAKFYAINRGGDITYHGPGQIVGYPIFDLDHFFSDIHKYLRYLEEAIIQTLADYGIKAGRIEGLTGVWIDENDPSKARKIAALGVKCSRWVTMHGFAFNVNTDNAYFGNIIPCGITDKAVTSMEKELGKKLNFQEVSAKLKSKIASVFEIQFMES